MTRKPRTKRRIVGQDEIHKVIEIHTSIGDPTPDKMMDLLNGVFWRHVDSWEKFCLDILEENGLPNPMMKVAYRTRRKWVYAGELENEDEKRKFPHIDVGETFINKFQQVFSDTWYAAKIAARCGYIKSSPDLPTEHHLNAIFSIGYNMCDWKWRREQETKIIARQRQLQTNKTNAPAGGKIRSDRFKLAKKELENHFLSIGNLEKFTQKDQDGKLRAMTTYAERYNAEASDDEKIFLGMNNRPLLGSDWFSRLLTKWKKEGKLPNS